MKEALKLALEAVEEAVDCAKHGYISNYLDDWENAIAAIKEALSEPEQEPCLSPCGDIKCAVICKRHTEHSEQNADRFCDANCVWTDHHPDCKLAQPDRQELQAKGKHPSPCARFCEANAFQIEIRNLKAKLENQHPEWYYTKNIHGCDVFYHKTEERSYMSGEITPLYTTPPQRKPLTISEIAEGRNNADMGGTIEVDAWSFAKGVYWAEQKHGIKE